MIITLTPDLERTLTERAEQQGTTPELLALQNLRELYQGSSPSESFAGKTLADVLAGQTGTIRSSEHTGIAVSRLSEDEMVFRQPGLHAGRYWITDDFDAPLIDA